MKIDQFQHGSVLVLVPHGPMTEDEVSSLRDALDDAQSSPRVVLCMREVSYMDSQGLEFLLDMSEKFESEGRRLRLAEIEDCCREILYLTDYQDAFEQYAGIDDAVRSLL
jgi:anti-anti-sigma factor